MKGTDFKLGLGRRPNGPVFNPNVSSVRIGPRPLKEEHLMIGVSMVMSFYFPYSSPEKKSSNDPGHKSLGVIKGLARLL